MRRLSVVSAVIAFLMICPVIIPMDGVDALDDQDYKLTVPGWTDLKEPIDVTISNGQSVTFKIYIENFTEHFLDATFFVTSENHRISGNKVENLTIAPKQGEESSLEIAEFVISVDEKTAPEKGNRLILDVILTDLSDDTYVFVPVHFTVNVESDVGILGAFNKFFGVIGNDLPAPFNSPTVPFVVNMIGFVAASLLIGYALYGLFLSKREMSDIRKKRIRVLIAVCSISVGAMSSLGIGLEILGYDSDLSFIVMKSSEILITVIIGLTVWKLYTIVLNDAMVRVGKEKVDREALMHLYSKLGLLAIGTICTAAILHILGHNITNIILGAGFAGLFLTYGASNILSQMFHGVSMILTRRFREGDYILFNNKVYIVKKIRITYTELMGTKRDRIYIIPNDKMASVTVHNSGIAFTSYRTHVYFRLPYGADLEKVEKILVDFVSQFDEISKDPAKAPVLKLMDFQNGDLLVRFDATAQFHVNDNKMRRAIYQVLCDNDIHIPYERIEVAIVDDNYNKTLFRTVNRGWKTGGWNKNES